jgi:hypothetical protein
MPPGDYTLKVIDSGKSFNELTIKVGKVPEFTAGNLIFENAGKGKVKISNPEKGYTYCWYDSNIPDYVPKFPNGKYYGYGITSTDNTFKVTATVIENRGGVFIRDTSKNDFGSWIHLKIYTDGDDHPPFEFSINTSQNGRYAKVLEIQDQETDQIVIDNNYTFKTEKADITWNGIIRDGYMELREDGFLNSTMKLYYSMAYNGREEPLAKGIDFQPQRPGNYYIEAVDLKTGARSVNRTGIAITKNENRGKVKAVAPDKTTSSNLIMWLDANDLDANGEPDGKLFRRGSANGARSKAGNIGFHFFNYFPNKQNGKPVLSWRTIWIQSLSEPINDYQTIIMVRKESDFSSEGTAPWRELDGLIGTGRYGENLFMDSISEYTINGSVWINGNKIDPANAKMPVDFYIASYEFSEVLDKPFKITDGHWEGELTEVLVFDSKLEQKEREAVEEYLYQKWISGVNY